MKKHPTTNRSGVFRTNIMAVALSLATIGSAMAQSQSLTLDSCYARANRNYPLIKQYALIEKTKEYTLSNANKAYLPQLSITAIEGYIFGGLPSFGPGQSDASNFKFIGIGQLNQTLWDGGATRTQKNIITASSEAEKASVDVSMYDLQSRVNQLYFGILLVDEQLKQLEAQDKLLSNNVSRIKQLNDNGLAYKTDLDEIKVEQLKLAQKKTEYQYTREGYAMMLSLLIGARINEQTVLQKPPVIDLPTDLQIMRPELSLFRGQRNLVTAQAGMQRASMMPKIGLLGAAVMFAPGLALGNETRSSIGIGGLSASWNLGGLYKNSNEKKLTQQSLTRIEVQEEVFLFNTRLQMTQASSDMAKQKAILEGDDQIVSLRKSLRESYQLKYDTGAGSLMDLLNATDKESEANSQKALHEMQLLMTISAHKTITGN